MSNINYLRIVPNSHYFGSLNNILVHYEQTPEELTKEYLFIGFTNTFKRGLEIQKIDKSKNEQPLVFKSIYDILHIIENDPVFSLDIIISIIKRTIASGYDLKKKIKMERKEVYERLDTERQYQDLRWTPRREKNGTPDEEKPIAEWINYMEFHLAKAKEKIYYLEDEEALAEVRKVTALGVRAMEIHGCPERIIPEEFLDGDENE